MYDLKKLYPSQFKMLPKCVNSGPRVLLQKVVLKTPNTLFKDGNGEINLFPKGLIIINNQIDGIKVC
jgi:hypothetical protein